MYVGSAKPFQRMRGNLIFEFANWPHCNCCPHKTPCNQRDICTLPLTPPPAITEHSQSFRKVHAHRLPCDQQHFWRILNRGDVDAMGRPGKAGHLEACLGSAAASRITWPCGLCHVLESF